MSDHSAPDISLVILSWNTEELTRKCLGALRDCAAGSPRSHEIIVIDNASEDGSVEMVRAEFPEVRLYLNDENQGYARGVNQGLALARGRHVTLLGSDTEVRPGTLDVMAGFLEENSGVGACAPRLVNPDGSLQRACMRFPDLKVAMYYDTVLEDLWPENSVLHRYHLKDWDHENSQPVDQPPGTCLMVKREVLDAVGPMDRKLWLFFNDVDWCMRIRNAGYEIWYLHEDTEVQHVLGASTSRHPSFSTEWHKNRLWFYQKHFHFAGSFIVRLAILYVGARELRRIRRNLESTREFLQHARQVIGTVVRVALS